MSKRTWLRRRSMRTVPRPKPWPERKRKDASKAKAEEALRRGDRPKGRLWLLVLTVVTIGMLYTIPVQIAIRNPISGLIFGFGLWEAWKIARESSCRSTGHFVWSTRHPRFTTMADDGLTSSIQKAAHSCPTCGSEVAPNLLSCPSCRRLVHSDRLNELADTAEAAEHDGDLTPHWHPGTMR